MLPQCPHSGKSVDGFAPQDTVWIRCRRRVGTVRVWRNSVDACALARAQPGQGDGNPAVSLAVPPGRPGDRTISALMTDATEAEAIGQPRVFEIAEERRQP